VVNGLDKTSHAAGGASPCDLLLQLVDTGYVKHDSKVNGGLQPILVQLLFQWLLQVDPSLLVLLVEVPQAKICYLRSEEASRHFTRQPHSDRGNSKATCESDGPIYL